MVGRAMQEEDDGHGQRL